MSIILKTAFAVALTLTGVPVLAETIYLTGPDGRWLRISCDREVCRVLQRTLDGCSHTIEKMPGGDANFEMLKIKYRAAGFR